MFLHFVFMKYMATYPGIFGAVFILYWNIRNLVNRNVMIALEKSQTPTKIGLHIEKTPDRQGILWHAKFYTSVPAQLPGPVLKAFGKAQLPLFSWLTSPPWSQTSTQQGGSVSQLSQLAKLSPWLTLSTKDITTSFWHYKKWFCFLSNQIMGLYHFSKPIE